MIRNHNLSKDFDISETFREKIKAKQKKENANIEKDKVEEIINKKQKIAKIYSSSDGLYTVSTGDKKYIVSSDELVLIIRQSPHLFYSKKNNLFLNLKLIRVIEKLNDDKVIVYFLEDNQVDYIETKFDNIHDFFDLITKDLDSNINSEDFDFIKEKQFKVVVEKFIRKNLFEQEYKNLKLNNTLSLTTVFSACLFYFIPFIPFVGFTKYSLTIFPTTTFLIAMLLYQRIDNKKRLIELK